MRRECGAADWRVLRALEPVSMGAGVIPAASCGGGDGGAHASVSSTTLQGGSWKTAES